MITYRKANPEDVFPALALALRVFIEFEAPVYDQGAVEKFKADCVENREYIENYITGKHLMFIAVDNERIVGIVNERGNGRISMMFVDGKYHRQGIATALMERIVCELKMRGIDKVNLHSSPYGVPFYKHFGFMTTDVEQKIDCFTVTPMEYTIEDDKVSKPNGIIVFGANGSGKTTLGRELAHILDFKHMDHEDYAFKESKIPYTVPRTNEECIELMLADIEKYRSFVISAVTGDFGDTIPRFYKLAVYLAAPIEIRMKRIKQREYEKFGERVREGGDMYEQRLKFHDFVASRPLSRIEQWAETLTCPVIHIDGTKDWRVNAAEITEHFKEIVRCEDCDRYGE